MRGLPSVGRLFGRDHANDSSLSPPVPPAADSQAALSPPVIRARKLENLRIRWLIRRDMPDVLRIEQEAYTDPWREDDFLRILRQRDCIAMIAGRMTAGGDDRVIGYMVYQFGPRHIVLRNIAVHPLFRGQSVGTQLVGRLKDKLHKKRRVEVLTRVWERNLAAQLFFKAEGFSCRAIEHDVYRNGDAAYVFSFRI